MSKVYHICTACNVKVYDWEKHINTKKHCDLAKKSMFSKVIFDSHMMNKYTPCCQFIPKTKHKSYDSRVEK